MLDSFIIASRMPSTAPPKKPTRVNHSVFTRAVVMISGNSFAATAGSKNCLPKRAQSVLRMAQATTAMKIAYITRRYSRCRVLRFIAIAVNTPQRGSVDREVGVVDLLVGALVT